MELASKRKTDTRNLVRAGILSALIIVMTVVPYTGYINYGLVEITTLHIVVAVGAVMLGWQYGAAIWRQQWGTVRVLAYRYLRARRGVLELGRVSRDPAWQQQQAAFQQGTLDRAGSLRMGWRLLAHLQLPKGLRGARLRRYIGWRAALPGLATPDGSTTTGDHSACHASASNSATSNSGKKEG